MRKAKLSLLAAAIFAGMAGTTLAAERAGFGLEWGMGPTIQLGDFDMQMDQSFSVEFSINEDFGVSLFSSQGRFSGEHEYTDDITIPGQTFERGIQIGGNTSVEGIRLSYGLPFLKMLRLGIELGRLSIEQDYTDFHNSDGTTSSNVDFGGVSQQLDEVAAMEGVSLRANLLSGATGALTASLGVQASLRFAQFRDRAVFGIQETTVDPLLHPVKEEIETITSYNTLAVAAALNIGF